jgi:predicted anti-sigma-YlaC factor YlaD
MASPHIAFAEALCIGKQDRNGFEVLLRKALEIDPEARPEWRLQNLVAQRRAQWLLSQVDELFLDEGGAAPTTASLSVPLPW